MFSANRGGAPMAKIYFSAVMANCSLLKHDKFEDFELPGKNECLFLWVNGKK
jgi:hypothetical protein